MYLIWVLLLATSAFAQNPVSDPVRGTYASLKRNLTEAVDKAPESLLSFKPTPDVMTFSELVIHITNSNFSDCSVLKGEPNPNAGDRKPGSKADLQAFVQSGYAYCDSAIQAFTDAQLSDKVKRGSREVVKAGSLIHLVTHPSLHYGNLITYMRLKGMVPPETERAQAAAATKK